MSYKNVKISEEELKILELPKRISGIEVAKKLRFPAKTNFNTKFELSLTPYLELPLSLIGKNSVEWIFIIKPTQSGGTVFLQATVADAIDQDPGSLIYVTPNEILTGKGMKRIGEIIKGTPDLAKHIINKRSISKVKIDLDNMEIFPAWAGSLGTLSETPAKRVVLDEIRLMPLTMGDESNAIKMAEDRLTTFKKFGLAQGYGVSTPSIEGDLLHQQLTVVNTRVLRWHIRCWNCGKPQILDFWKNIRINKDTKKPECICVACGYKFDDKDNKKFMNKNGFYAPYSLKDSELCDSLEMPELKGRVICWYSSLDSPFRSWSAIYNEYIQTRDKLHDYKNFIQCWLVKFWIDDISKTSVALLKERKDKSLDRGIVPSWCKVLLGGIDTQDDGFYVTIRAFGSGKKSHLVDHYFISCKIGEADTPTIYKLIKTNLQDRIFQGHKVTVKWKVALYGWDTGGHRTKHIYAAVAMGLINAVMVKGRDNQDTSIRYNKEIDLYLVRNIEYLEETEKHSMSEDFTLPDDTGLDYLRHFCNIRKKRDENKKTGEKKVIWVRVGKYDYRMADVHAYICLDIPHADGTFRNRLNEKGYIFNPMVKRLEVIENTDDDHVYEDEDDRENYQIDEIDWDN